MNDRRKLTLPVTGMSCAACAQRTEKNLNRASGVDGASVNFATKLATIEFDPSATDTNGLVDVIRRTGFDTAGLQSYRLGLPLPVPCSWHSPSLMNCYQDPV